MRHHFKPAAGSPDVNGLIVLLGAALLAQGAAIKQDPLIVPPLPQLKELIPLEVKATRPDLVVFVPRITDEGVNDTGNEHFLVFDGPDGSLMAVWTQSTFEAQPDQHIVFAQSKDEGRTCLV